MRHFRSRYFRAVAVLLVLGLAGCANRQTAPAPAAGASNPIENFCAETQSSVPLGVPKEILAKPGFTELSAAVTDSNGKEVIGLKQSDFIASTSAEPLPVAYFHESPKAPVTLGILVDTSLSMQPKLRLVNTVLSNFMTRIDACDELFLFAFSSRPFMLEPLTTDHAAAASRLTLLHAFGQTSLYDSILDGMLILQHGHYSQKALLVITDGMDNTSRATLDRVTALARQRRVPIYVIGIGDPTGSLPGIAMGPFSFAAINSVDAKAVNELANAAGGQAFIVPPTGNEFADAAASVQRQLSPGYTIGVIMPASGIPSIQRIATPGSTPRTSESAGTPPLRLAIANHPDAVVTTHIINPPH